MESLEHTSEYAVAVPATERRNPASYGIDDMSALELLTLLNEQDRLAVEAVASVLPNVSSLVVAAAKRLRSGGSVHYFGAGTSGRLAALDAAELLPTFNLEPGIVQAHIAGGERGLVHAVEHSEDSEEDGSRDAGALGESDVAIGLTASGTTPYVAGALRAAHQRGALTALITSNQAAPLAPLADILITPNTGSEVLTGSTRLKAGTAQKVILNGFSTALMVSAGRTYSNLMVSVVATNTKLQERALRIVAEVGGISHDESVALLGEAGGDVVLAIVHLLGGASLKDSKRAIKDAHGSVRDAVRLLALTHSVPSPAPKPSPIEKARVP